MLSKQKLINTYGIDEVKSVMGSSFQEKYQKNHTQKDLEFFESILKQDAEKTINLSSLNIVFEE